MQEAAKSDGDLAPAIAGYESDIRPFLSQDDEFEDRLRVFDVAADQWEEDPTDENVLTVLAVFGGLVDDCVAAGQDMDLGDGIILPGNDG